MIKQIKLKRQIQLKSIENEETVMGMTMTKTIITKIIVIIMMIMRIKISHCINL